MATVSALSATVDQSRTRLAARRIPRLQARETQLASSRAAALSGSAFFERFTRTVGLPPMECLLAWRMAVEKDLLRREGVGLAEVAERVGYGSASTPSAPRSADTWAALRIATQARNGSARRSDGDFNDS